MQRKLATIRKINNITPIEGADRIELAHVDGWKIVIAKDVGYKINDIIVYCEIDSFLPIEPEFEFLRKSSFKKMGGKEGFRLKTIRLRNQISQGLIIPLKDAINIIERRSGKKIDPNSLEIGTDVTNLLGIIKYEYPIPAQLSGEVIGRFPAFIQKTDEERIQNLTEEYEEWKNLDGNFFVTEKLHGTSATFFINEDEFRVCSRNLKLKENDNNTYWKIARELNIEEKLRKLNRNIAIQGEIIGEGIQKNPYNIKGHTVRFFNVFDIDEFNRVDFDDFIDIIKNKCGFETVPIVSSSGFKLPETIDELIKKANGLSLMNDQICREGIVIRSRDNQISFKVINNKFLLNE